MLTPPPALSPFQGPTPSGPARWSRVFAIAMLTFGLGACANSIPAQDGTSKSDNGGPGSFEAFCADNPQDETCLHCQQNPQECGGSDDTSPTPTPGSDPVNCQKTPQAPECQGGGDDLTFEQYCQQNPQDQDCVYCQQNPQDQFCLNPDGQGGGTDCQQNPQDPACQGGGTGGTFEQYCQQNPQDQDCVYCQQNPQDQFCLNPDGQGGGTDCQQNPQDPACQDGGTGGTFEQYCQQNPQDQDCVYCQQNPQDPYCQG